GTGCSLPIGALARKTDEGYSLIARVVSPDGETCLDTRVDWREGAPEDAGLRAAKILIDQGAIELLGAGVLDR
ncbi:MAG TPA: hypothetical protein VNI20_10895, partial [Fimbriimonadaceae bacterium]|nr:hypothetical protein [Fimbriimonadaceae bacterium]